MIWLRKKFPVFKSNPRLATFFSISIATFILGFIFFAFTYILPGVEIVKAEEVDGLHQVVSLLWKSILQTTEWFFSRVLVLNLFQEQLLLLVPHGIPQNCNGQYIPMAQIMVHANSERAF